MAGVGRDSKLDEKKIRKIRNKVKDMAVAYTNSHDHPKVTWDNLLIEVNKAICADDPIKDKKSLMRNQDVKAAYDEAIALQRQRRFKHTDGMRSEMTREQLLQLLARQDVEISELKKQLGQLADFRYTKLMTLATLPATSEQILRLRDQEFPDVPF